MFSLNFTAAGIETVMTNAEGAPLCPWPKAARYVGGAKERAERFAGG